MQERNRRILQEAGLSRPELVGEGGPPAATASALPGSGSASPGSPAPAPAGIVSRLSGDFADDYSDPMLAAATPAGTGFMTPAEAATLSLSATAEQVMCLNCQMPQPASHRICGNCGQGLELSAQEESDLMLSKLSARERAALPESAFVFPRDRTYPIHDIAHARLALSRSSGRPEEETVQTAVFGRYPSLRFNRQHLDQEQEHAVSFFDNLALAEVRRDGLVWKAICKTGELALSPGPGQIDVDKPLKLTPELFDELVMSVQERAFPYVTVPTTHNNSLLENTGYVRKLEKRESEDPGDPPGTEVLWAGIEFTEPDIAAKTKRGTIPDTSVGVKFNYRNKRTGKLFPAALEHVALTHQPWVDGLIPFGQSLSQEGVFDREAMDAPWDGVYMHIDQREEEDTRLSQGDILPSENELDGIPSVPPLTRSRRPTGRRRAPSHRETVPDSVEELMASQQARIEAAEQRAEEAEVRLGQYEGRVAQQGEAIHLANIAARVDGWQDDHVPPKVVQVARDILLAAGPQGEVTEESALLTLSVTRAPEREGENPIIEQVHLSVEGVVERILDAVPRFHAGQDVHEVLAGLDELNASQPEGEQQASAEERAQRLLDDARNRGSGVA
jgi:hypothetical protein